MSIVKKQGRFLVKLALLILEAQRRGLVATGGELWRPDVVAEWYAAHHQGIKNSVHRLRFACDLNVFDALGNQWKTVEDYRPLGEFWESLSEPDLKLCWGGRFGDADHFSAEHEGVR